LKIKLMADDLATLEKNLLKAVRSQLEMG